jgi:hypothetical protein
MITLNLRDPRLGEHAVMVQNLRRIGVFTDEEIQELYDRQLEKDAEEAQSDG